MKTTINLSKKNAKQLGTLHKRMIKAAKKAARQAEELAPIDPRRQNFLRAAEEANRNASKIKIHLFKRSTARRKAFDRAMNGIQSKLKATQTDGRKEENTEGDRKS